jgi:hypothetical protein
VLFFNPKLLTKEFPAYIMALASTSITTLIFGLDLKDKTHIPLYELIIGEE